MTHGMPGGLRVHIIAPFDSRIANLARNEDLSEADARSKVRLLDQDRDAFVSRYWPRLADHDQVFHITLNASLLTEEQMVQSVVPLIG